MDDDVTKAEIQAVMRELGKRGGTRRAQRMTKAERSAGARKAALARAKKLTPEQRSAIASKAALSRKKGKRKK